MDLLCYLHPGWEPLIRPAEATRPWMDATPESFAYRCLPLNIANAHGWEILTPVAFDACWSGGGDTSDVTIRLPVGTKPDLAPVSIFGQGVLTFHIFGLFRTPPGWNLFVRGPTNTAKDGIAPLDGIVETDWSHATFTMNWRFTRPGTIEFDIGEPVCMFHPVERKLFERFEAEIAGLEDDAELHEKYKVWSGGRDQFNKDLKTFDPNAVKQGWQKDYFQSAEETKPRPQPFRTRGVPNV